MAPSDRGPARSLKSVLAGAVALALLAPAGEPVAVSQTSAFAAATSAGAAAASAQIVASGSWRRVGQDRTVTVALRVTQGVTADSSGSLTGVAAETTHGVSATATIEICLHYPPSCQTGRVSGTSAAGFLFVFDPLLRNASFSGVVQGNRIEATWTGAGALALSGSTTPTGAPETLEAGADSVTVVSRPQDATFASSVWAESMGVSESLSAALAYEGLASASVSAAP